MTEMARILCPTDFSKFSFRASDYAVALAKRYGAELHYLHVIPGALLHPDQYPYVQAPIVPGPEIRRQAEERLDAFVALAHADDARKTASVVEGSPIEQILETAETMKASLICLGTHGREGFERLVLGSVAEKVLRKANCPVLTVSEPRDEAPTKPALFKRILCPIDFGPSSLAALEYALSLAQEAEGELLLLNVVEWFFDEPGWEKSFSVEGYREQMEERIEKRLAEMIPDEVRNWCSVKTMVRSGKSYVEVLEAAREFEAELIVMGVTGRNPLDLMVFGSTTNHLVRKSEVPVLTVRRPRDAKPAKGGEEEAREEETS